jgi:hypothetical protein
MSGTEPHAEETGLMDWMCTSRRSRLRWPRRAATEQSAESVFAKRAEVLTKLAARLSSGGPRLSFCYEAGPCGYGFYRRLTGCGHDCVVVAPC